MKLISWHVLNCAFSSNHSDHCAFISALQIQVLEQTWTVIWLIQFTSASCLWIKSIFHFDHFKMHLVLSFINNSCNNCKHTETGTSQVQSETGHLTSSCEVTKCKGTSTKCFFSIQSIEKENQLKSSLWNEATCQLSVLTEQVTIQVSRWKSRHLHHQPLCVSGSYFSNLLRRDS